LTHEYKEEHPEKVSKVCPVPSEFLMFFVGLNVGEKITIVFLTKNETNMLNLEFFSDKIKRDNLFTFKVCHTHQAL